MQEEMFMSNKYPFTIKKLPLEDPRACPVDLPHFDYDFYYDYQDTHSSWEFDKWKDPKDNSNDLYSGLSFRGECIDNILNEVLPFQRQKGKSAFLNDGRWAGIVGWYKLMEVDNMNHGGFKDVVTQNRHPTLQKVINWFEFESDIESAIMEKMPGNVELWHVDSHCGHKHGHRKKELTRILIHLQDWEFGQMMMWGTRPLIQWRAGDAITYDVDIPHCSFNSSRHIRYTLRITGVPSNATKEKLAKGGNIDMDNL